MRNFNGIGLHILFDEVNTDTEVWKLINFIDRLNPSVINILGGARRDQAWEFGRLALARWPGMRIIFRIWPDDGNHAKDIYQDPSNWIKMATPFLASGMTVLVDNESTTSDYIPYANWMASIMDACAIQGWKVAVGRTPTGNPGDGEGGSVNQYYQLKPMIQALARHGSLHTYSPNEYQGQGYLPGGTPGHTGRYKNTINEATKLGLKIEDISIGEWSIAYQEPSGWLDAGKGWKNVPGLTGERYAQQLIDNYKQYYQPQGVACSIYGWGDSIGGQWDSFRVDQDTGFQNVLLAEAASGRLELKPNTSPIVIPPPVVVPPAPIRYRVQLPAGNTYINVRSTWTLTGCIVGQLKHNDIVQILEQHIDTSGILWYHINTGWTSTQGKPGSPRIKFIQV